jgi:hypothetical protein
MKFFFIFERKEKQNIRKKNKFLFHSLFCQTILNLNINQNHDLTNAPRHIEAIERNAIEINTER